MEERVTIEATAQPECPQCGAEVRTESSFCYNCGMKVASQSFKSAEVIETNNERGPQENGLRKNGPGWVAAERRKGPARAKRPLRAHPSEPVQVVWRPVSGMGIGFLLLSIFASLFCVVLIVIAYYLR
jgi:hypothetical protein